jgi:hypothetical protein
MDTQRAKERLTKFVSLLDAVRNGLDETPQPYEALWEACARLDIEITDIGREMSLAANRRM